MTAEELQTALASRIPKNTQKATSWGMGVWNAWCKARNTVTNTLPMPVKVLNELMARFIQEVCKKDGSNYIPSTLMQLVAAVQLYLNENGRPEVRFFDFLTVPGCKDEGINFSWTGV